MWDNVIGDNVRRCNRNLLISSVVILGVVAALLWCNRIYWYNFLFGPFPTTLEQLANNPDALRKDKCYFKVKGEKTMDTGIQQLSRTYDRHTNEVRSETVEASYLVLKDRNRYMVLEAPKVTEATEVAGNLTEIPDQVSNAFIRPVVSKHPELKEAFVPYMLQTGGFRGPGMAFIPFMLGFTGLALFNLKRYRDRTNDLALHPCVRTLAKLGDPKQLAAEIGVQYKEPDRKEFGSISLMRSWMLGRGMFGFECLPLSNLVWVHRMTTNHSVNFIPTGSTHEVMAYFKDRKQPVRFSADKKTIDNMVQHVGTTMPWVIAGYSDELKNIWNKHPEEMIQEVERRKRGEAA